MNKCFICGVDTKKPFFSFLYHFRLLDFDSFKFFKGNFDRFGVWIAIEQIMPILQIKTCWETRGKSLKFPFDFKNKND